MQAEILARLNPRGVDMDNVVASTGEKLTWEDVAALLSGLPQGPYLLGRLVYAGDDTVVEELKKLLYREVSGLAERQNWKCTQGNNKLDLLCQLALVESLKNNNCATCKGTGIHRINKCARCNGSGKQRMRDSERARYLDVNKRKWKCSWDNKYYIIQTVLWSWQAEVGAHLEKYFAEVNLTKGDKHGTINPRIENLALNLSL